HRKDGFKPLFDHDPEAVLTGLCRGFGDGFSFGIDPSEVCVDAIRLIHPDTQIIASLMRAIKNRFALKCRYVSLSSGESERVIVPHAIINNGHRWHVRAYDRKSGQFRDFVCSRFCNMEVQIEPAEDIEKREQDKQWNRIVDLSLVPHPGLKIPRAIEMDYQMKEGKLKLEVRAAIVGYLLQQWNVDCSKETNLSCFQYQLALANPATLYGVDNLLLAPGYET
ncbi:MAG: WYL domain-containing protein, partial [Algicola sp.]|nr:WYL domain-containing protein [Algicola sp.]